MHILLAAPRDDMELALELLAIQKAAYSREAELVGDDRIPPLHESVDELRSATLLWLVAYLDGTVAGAIGWTEDDTELDIDRLVVAPHAHRRGVGSALVSSLIERAGTRRLVVSTGKDNTPATSLYEQLGFVRQHDTEVLPGLIVTQFHYA